MATKVPSPNSASITPPKRRNLISPTAALGLIGGMRQKQAKALLLTPICSGIIYSQAEAITTADSKGALSDVRGARVKADLWEIIRRAGVDDQLWSTGSIAMPTSTYVKGGLRIVTGITIDADDVAKFAARHNCTPRAPRVNPGGRPTAKWWADFAQELAVYVQIHGIPAGVGAEGQGELIEAVTTKMIERGCDETPGRSSIQDCVQAVMDRIRAEDAYSSAFGFLEPEE